MLQSSTWDEILGNQYLTHYIMTAEKTPVVNAYFIHILGLFILSLLDMCFIWHLTDETAFLRKLVTSGMYLDISWAKANHLPTKKKQHDSPPSSQSKISLFLLE